jgi:hypothetical protein
MKVVALTVEGNTHKTGFGVSHIIRYEPYLTGGDGTVLTLSDGSLVPVLENLMEIMNMVNYERTA